MEGSYGSGRVSWPLVSFTVVSIELKGKGADARVTNRNRIHDFRTRMVVRKLKLGHQQLHVSLGVPFLLQHSLGVDTSVDTV